jgi:hypothetical protein
MTLHPPMENNRSQALVERLPANFILVIVRNNEKYIITFQKNEIKNDNT